MLGESSQIKTTSEDDARLDIRAHCLLFDVKIFNPHARTSYEVQLKLLNLLPLPVYLQLNDILLLRKLTSEEVRESKLPERETKSGRAHELFKTL